MFLADLAAADKNALLRDLATKAAASIALPEEAVAAGLLKREALGSTGIGAGIAMPHARFAGLSKSFGLFARFEAGRLNSTPSTARRWTWFSCCCFPKATKAARSPRLRWSRASCGKRRWSSNCATAAMPARCFGVLAV